MFTSSDLQALRSQKMTNRDIMEMTAKVIPSAYNALKNMDADKTTPDARKEQIMGQMLDDNAKKAKISSLLYINALGANAAVKQHDSLQGSYDAQEQSDRYQYQGSMGLSDIPKIGYNFVREGVDMAKQAVTDPGNFVKGMINPIAGAAQMGVEAIRHPIQAMEAPFSKSVDMPNTVFGDTEAKQSALELAQAYGLKDAAEGIGNIAQGNVTAGLNDISTGIGQANKTIYENPLSSYLMAKGGKEVLARGARAAKLYQASDAIQNFNPGQIMADTTKSMIPEGMRPAIESAGKSMIDAGMNAPKTIANAAVKFPQEVYRKMSGLQTGTFSEGVKAFQNNPDEFQQAQRVGPQEFAGTIGDRVKQGIDQQIEEKITRGAAYDPIKVSNKFIKVPTDKLTSFVEDKFGVKWNPGENGKAGFAEPTGEVHLSAGDVKALNEFMNKYGTKPQLSQKAFFAGRDSLSHMADYFRDSERTPQSKYMSEQLYGLWNAIARGEKAKIGGVDVQFPEQIKGLKSIDDSFSAQTKFLKGIKNTYLEETTDPNTGETSTRLKKSALDKILSANPKDPKYQNIILDLETVSPGISNSLRIYRVLQDVNYAKSGRSVGSYLRNAAIGGSGMATYANPAIGIPALIATIATSPDFAPKLMEWYGKVKGINTSDINFKMQSGMKLTPKESTTVSDAMSAFEDSTGIAKGGVDMKALIQKYGSEDAIPLNELSPQGTADAAAGEAILKNGGTVEQADAVSGAPTGKFPNLTPEEIKNLTPEEKATGLIGGSDNSPKVLPR